VCGRLPHPREKAGAGTGPSPVDRRKTGSKHHLICDGKGTPFRVITTAANVDDVTQTLALIDGIPPVAGRPGHPRRRPDSLLGDKGYDSNPNRRELRKRRILPVISRKGAPNIKGLGKLRYVVEQTFALLHQFKRLAVRRERRTQLRDAFVSLACSSSLLPSKNSGVAVGPGATALTVTSRPRSSRARIRVMASTAPLVAAQPP
jgi:transposase